MTYIVVLNFDFGIIDLNNCSIYILHVSIVYKNIMIWVYIE